MKEIKIEKNPFNIFLDRLTIVVLIILIINVFISTNLKTTFFVILAISIIGFLMQLLITKSRIFETKILTDELKTAINNLDGLNNSKQEKVQNLENKKVNEWSFSKIMSRILIYPFCIILIWLVLTLMIPEGKIPEAIFAIIVALAYPISDLLIIINKKKLKLTLATSDLGIWLNLKMVLYLENLCLMEKTRIFNPKPLVAPRR